MDWVRLICGIIIGIVAISNIHYLINLNEEESIKYTILSIITLILIVLSILSIYTSIDNKQN